jgi:regulator of protease activity HflC (stomatin/prohibitin superfamily)
MKLKRETKLIIQNELPCEPEKIWRTKEGEDSKTIPEGYFPPIRITFGPPITDEKDPNFIPLGNPYNKQMTIEVTPVISWRIMDMKTFVSTIGTIERTIRQMEDVAITVFAEDFAKITPALALKNLNKHSEDLKIAIGNRVLNWGIEIMSAQIKPFGFSRGLNQSVIDVSKAEQAAKATRIGAAADRDATIDKGTGIAEAEKLLLEARAIGTKKLAEACNTTEGQIALWMETMGKAFEKAQYSIVPGSELFTSIAGIKEMLEKVKGGRK